MYATPYTPSPAASTPANLSRSTHNARGREQTTSRKRPRSDYFTTHSPPPTKPSAANTSRSRLSDQYRRSSRRNSPAPLNSPQPLASSRYRLQHGLDTPSLTSLDSTTTPLGGDQDPIFHRKLASPTSCLNDSYIHTSRPSALSRERNGAPRGTQLGSMPSEHVESWSTFAWRLASGTACAVWNFCSSPGFSGFKAGGGQAYRFNNSAPIPASNDEDGSRTTIPGDWPNEAEYVKVSASEGNPDRPAKRRQVTQEDWVLVHGQRPSPLPLQAHGAYSSALQPHPSLPAPGPSPRSASRSFLPRPSMHGKTSRASMAPSRTSSTTYVNTVSAGSPPPRPQRHASTASMRSPHASPQQNVRRQEDYRLATDAEPKLVTTPKKRSPAAIRGPVHDPYDINNPIDAPTQQRTPSSAEAISKYRRRRERDDRKQEASYRKMNDQLEDLINQGRVALASSFEVGEEMDVSADGEFSGDSGVEMGYEEEDCGLGWNRDEKGASSACLGRAWA